MVWTLKSDKTGQEYDFEDSIQPAEALKYLDTVLEPTQTWKNVAETTPRALQTGLLKAQSSVAKAGEDFIVKPLQKLQASLMDPIGAIKGTLGDPAGSQWAQEQVAKAKAAQEALAVETKGVPSTLQQAAQSAAVSIGETAPDLLAGAGAATLLTRAGVSTAKAVTLAAETALKSMAGREAAREYGEQRESGNTPLRSLGPAAVTAVAEYFPEKMAWTPVMKLLKTGDSNVRRAVAELVFKDIAGEELTTAVEWLNRKTSREPNLTLGELVQEMQVTALSAGISSPIQGAVGGAAYKLALRKKIREEMAGGNPTGDPAAPPETPPAETPAAPRTRLVSDSTLPIVGSPETSLPIGRELLPDAQLSLLRKAWDSYQKLDAFSTPEDRIRARGEYLQRRAQFEKTLSADPTARALMRTADLEMGLKPFETVDAIENDALTLSALTPRQEEALRLQREMSTEPDSTSGMIPLIPRKTRDALGIPEPGAFQGVDSPSTVQMRQPSTTVVEKHLAGHIATHGDAEFLGKPYEEIIQTLPAGKVVYFGRPNVSSDANLHGSSAVQEILQGLVQTFLPGKSVVIGSLERKSSAFSRAFVVKDGVYGITLPDTPGPSGASFFSRVRNKFQMSEDKASVLETALHEFSHILHLEHWQNTPITEKHGVAAEFHADLKKLAEGSVEDVLRIMGPRNGTSFMQTYLQLGGNPKAKWVGNPLVEEAFPHSTSPEYWYNFNEWIANKGSRYFLTRLGVRAENVNFFKRWIAKMRQFYSELTLKYMEPGPNFSMWLDNLAARESGMLGVLRAEEVMAIRSELERGGLDPALSGMLAAVRGSDTERLRRDAARLKVQMGTPDPATRAEGAFAQVLAAASAKNFPQLLKKISAFKFARDLSKHPAFKEDTATTRRMFLDTILGLSFPQKSAHMAYDGIRVWGYEYGDTSVMLEYDEASKELRVMENMFLGDGAVLAALRSTLRQLAAEGVGSVKISALPVSVKSALGLAPKAVNYTIPFWAYEPTLRPPEDSGQEVPLEMRLPLGLSSIGQKLGLPFYDSTANSLGRFNAFFRKALGSYQLIKLNENVPGMLEEKEALRNRMAYRHKWLKRANETVEQWAFKLPKTESSLLAKLLYDEAESGKSFSTMQRAANGDPVFLLDDAERRNRGLSLQAAEVYAKVRQDFMLFADEWHKTALWELARTELSDVTHLALAEAMRNGASMQDVQAIFDAAVASMKDPGAVARVIKARDAINTEFDAWKSKPYMPATRFGRYGVLVKEKASGNTLYFAGFDTPVEAAAEAERLKSEPRFTKEAISQTYLEDVPYAYAGLPPSFLDAMKSRLNLSTTQQAEFADVMQSLSYANSFLHRASRKAGIEGYSTDGLRAYSDYFRRGSSFIARVKSQIELDDAMKKLKTEIKRQTDQGADVVKLGQLHEWFTKLHTYLNDSKQEYGELKSLLALWHFGFNVATAAVNLAQVGIATFPYLSERYGTTRVFTELGKAYKDALAMYTGQSKLAPDEIAMLEHAMEAGFRDESQATVIAQIADGGALARVTPGSAFHRATNTMNHYAMWLFSKGELLNRDVTLLGAYRLRKDPNFHGKFDRDAFDFARTTVEDTHNEYAQENRPEFMRGAGSVVFQFMHYVQNMLFLHFGGDKSWWRLALMQLMVGGLMGMPNAEDMIQAAKFIGRRVFGKDWDAEREARTYLHDVGQNPDWYLRGLSGDVFGFDLSNRVSLGDVVPGMQAVGSHRKMNDIMYGAVGDAGGPAIALIMSGLKFMSEEDKGTWNAVKPIMPTAVRSIGSAAVAFTEGKVTDRSGAKVFEPDLWDVTGMAAGFMPKELSEFYDARGMQGELAAYWITRRQALFSIYKSLMLDRAADREGVADFAKRLIAYNKEIPEPALRVTMKQLRTNLKSTLRQNALKEAGLGTNRMTSVSSLEISNTFKSAE